MSLRQWSLLLCLLLGAVLSSGAACAGESPSPGIPPEIAKSFSLSGLALKNFGLYAKLVDSDASSTLAALNAEQPFVMASTTKLVTSLAALNLLGPDYRWRTRAFATGPLEGGRLAGDLVIVGGSAGITPGELSRWFKQMRREGLTEVTGFIVLERLALLRESNNWGQSLETNAVPPSQAVSVAPALPPVTGYANRAAPGSLVVAVAPSTGTRAILTLSPRPAGVTVVNDVTMGEGCVAWTVWESSDESGAGAPQLVVRGQWDSSCGKRVVASVRAPASVRLVPATQEMLRLPVMAVPVRAVPAVPLIVADLWKSAGGRLGGRVIETDRWSRGAGARSQPPWASQTSIPLAEVLREMNKNSNNLAARSLLLSLADSATQVRRIRLSGEAARLRDAQDRVHAWLLTQGLVEGDIRIDLGSGQSHAERGKPRALVQLLANAWQGGTKQIFLESLAIAGVDGTLARRMLKGPATGQAFLKTGTLSDTRALAGYVRAKSGKVYAVAAIVNHPKAAQATPSLDAFIEWIARNG